MTYFPIFCRKKMAGYPLRIFRDGRVEWRGVIHVALNCKMDVFRFPFDEQNCSLKWLLIPDQEDMSLTFVKTPSNSSGNSEWDLAAYELRDDTFHIVLRRRWGRVLSTLVIPFLLFNILVGLVYLLPTSSGERVGYSITLVLSFSFLMMQITDLVPPSNNGSPTGKQNHVYFAFLVFACR